MLWPMYKEKIENSSSKGAYGNANDWNAPGTDREDDGEVQFPEDVGRVNNQDYIRGYERYSKIDVKEIRVFEKFSGKEDLLTEDKFQEYLQKPAYILGGQIISDGQKAGALYAQMNMRAQEVHQQEIMTMQKSGYSQSDIEKAVAKGPEEILTKK